MNLTSQQVAQIKSTLKLLVEIVDSMEQKNCHACLHWDGKGCKMSGGLTPPEHVQANGCAKYENDDIPF